MIPALAALVATISGRFPRAWRPLKPPADPWAAFLRGRALDGRKDALAAFQCYLVAARAGLPVAAVMTWLAYRVGGGVLADPIAARAWARRATALGWPEILAPGGDQAPDAGGAS